MLDLEKIVAGAKLRGVAGPAVVEIVRVEWIGSDALNVVYRASGGPAGVGIAVGRSVRTAIVAVSLMDLFLSLAIWGATTTVRIAG